MLVKWLSCLTVDQKFTGSNPVHTAKFYFMKNPQRTMSVILTILFTVFALVEAIFNGLKNIGKT